jgi:ribonuclease Z
VTIVDRRRFLSIAAASAAAPLAAACSDDSVAQQPATTKSAPPATTPAPARGPEEVGRMRITILGSGSPAPDPDRMGPATLVEAAGTSMLVDCGRGVLGRLSAVGIAAPALGAVLITHLHSDHVTDLNDVITSRWALSLTPNPLRVIGPVGTQRVVDRTLAMLEDDIGYRLDHHDDLTEPPQVQVTEVSDGPVDLGVEGLAVSAAPTEHAPVRPTVGYRFEADGAVAAVVGDTIPCDGLDRLALGADVDVQTTVRRDLIETSGIPRLVDVLDYQSTIEQATDTATRQGVGTLVLTHLVPAPPVGSEAEAEWAALAAGGFDGEVVVARDLTTIEA